MRKISGLTTAWLVRNRAERGGPTGVHTERTPQVIEPHVIDPCVRADGLPDSIKLSQVRPRLPATDKTQGLPGRRVRPARRFDPTRPSSLLAIQLEMLGIIYDVNHRY